MSFAWSDFLTLAERMVRQPSTPGPEEAALRTSISRAYYATFGSARAFASTHDGFAFTSTGEDHTRLIAHFRFDPDAVRRQVGRDLKRLREFRNRADYDEPVINPMSLAQSSVAIARNVLNALNSLDTETPDE